MKASGCERYTVLHMVVTVAFPEGAVCCRNCRFCRNDDRMRQRYICGETFEILQDTGTIGRLCQLAREGMNEDGSDSTGTVRHDI